jgi:hypothetical protein
MRDIIFERVGSGATILVVPLNLFAWIIENNINILVALFVSVLSTIYMSIKIIDAYEDWIEKRRKRKIIKKT